MKQSRIKQRYLQKEKSSGITLIALVITIIILLILAGISISMISGDNGILEQVENAKTQSVEGEEIEAIELGYSDCKINPLGGEVTAENIGESLTKMGHNVTVDNGKEENEGKIVIIFNETRHKYTINQEREIERKEDVPQGPEVTYASEQTSYVGYYADIDGDLDVDGIIYADLAMVGSGKWNDDWGSYSYGQKTEGLKRYTISEDIGTGFGTWTKPVLTAIEGSGTVDRFYVMALEDVNPGTEYYWYCTAYNNLDNVNNVEPDENDFGTGKDNTVRMINAWNGTSYGGKTTSGNYTDMWGVIQPEDKDKNGEISEEEVIWFIPSKAELSAFCDAAFTKMNVTTGTYGNFGLKERYWSSTQGTSTSSFYANFSSGYISFGNVNGYNYVRMSAKF